MKLTQLTGFVLLSSFLTTVKAQQPIPFSDKRWTIQAQGQLQEAFKGYNALYLQTGIAWLKDEKFLNGIIEFDIYQSPRISFSGLVFRMTDPSNYEELYLRSHQVSNPDAFQYTPVFNNDPAWQLYHDPHDAVNDGFIHWKQRGINRGFNTVLEFPVDAWLHVKLLVKGKQAELYLGNDPKPVAFIRELLMGENAGSIGVKSGAGATWFANFSFTSTDNIEFKTPDRSNTIPTPPNSVMQWQVSNAFKESLITGMHQLDQKWLNGLKWKNAPTEQTGLLNLARYSAVSDSTNTMLVKLTFHSDIDQVKRLDMGYSDKIKVWCNGTALFSGNTGFRTRDYRYLGTIGYFDAVFLPLKKGDNIIICSVSETFGGWGIMAKWE